MTMSGVVLANQNRADALEKALSEHHHSRVQSQIQVDVTRHPHFPVAVSYTFPSRGMNSSRLFVGGSREQALGLTFGAVALSSGCFQPSFPKNDSNRPKMSCILGFTPPIFDACDERARAKLGPRGLVGVGGSCFSDVFSATSFRLHIIGRRGEYAWQLGGTQTDDLRS